MLLRSRLIALPGGTRVLTKEQLLDSLYAKQSGLADLNSANCWMGVDRKLPAEPAPDDANASNA